jgi:hypothetical protein
MRDEKMESSEIEQIITENANSDWKLHQMVHTMDCETSLFGPKPGSRIKANYALARIFEKNKYHVSQHFAGNCYMGAARLAEQNNLEILSKKFYELAGDRLSENLYYHNNRYDAPKAYEKAGNWPKAAKIRAEFEKRRPKIEKAEQMK